ncbi:MAG: acylphosphatase [Candidatus Krumholzibacteria bacterium]|nr:acylphosphatase [Candidatus Krumholzibacteria bacterium]
MSRVRLTVSGIVQGVGFRFFARSAAIQLKLNGYVRNLPDGRVEAEAQGSEDDLGEFVKRFGSGPGSSRVDDIRVEHIPEQVNDGFEIRF